MVVKRAIIEPNSLHGEIMNNSIHDLSILHSFGGNVLLLKLQRLFRWFGLHLMQVGLKLIPMGQRWNVQEVLVVVVFSVLLKGSLKVLLVFYLAY